MSRIAPEFANRSAEEREMILFKALLEGIPEHVYFKDRESRFIAVSRAHLRAFGKERMSDLIGRTDFDFFTEAHARPAFEDEQAIIRTGKPILNKLEQESWADGRVTWVLTTKVPMRNRAGEIVGTFGISMDVTEKKRLEDEFHKVHRDLVDASRSAGMAEVATGVLHNVGNVLNSLNVSVSVITSGLRQSKAESLGRIGALLREHESDLGAFLGSDPKGKKIPEFLQSVAQHTLQERDRLLDELASLQKNIDHIKEIVAMQQAYATMVGVVEALDPVSLMEDAIRMNAGALGRRNDIQVERAFKTTPKVLGEQAKVLQILVNLIRNAKFACDEHKTETKRVTLSVRTTPDSRVQFVVSDNGVGIKPENLTRIFQHGFTTKADGHGFGLHSSANAAREMKGSLSVHSEGPGQGATFTLELPAAAADMPSE